MTLNYTLAYIDGKASSSVINKLPERKWEAYREVGSCNELRSEDF